MKVQVRSVTGQTLDVENVTYCQSILNLKEQIELEYGFPVGVQRLIISGKELEDNALLNEINVVEGTILNIVIRSESRRLSDNFHSVVGTSQNHVRIDIPTGNAASNTAAVSGQRQQLAGTSEVDAAAPALPINQPLSLDEASAAASALLTAGVRTRELLSTAKTIEYYSVLDVVIGIVYVVAGGLIGLPFLIFASTGWIGARRLQLPLILVYAALQLINFVVGILSMAQSIKENADSILILFELFWVVFKLFAMIKCARFRSMFRAMTPHELQLLQDTSMAAIAPRNRPPDVPAAVP